MMKQIWIAATLGLASFLVPAAAQAQIFMPTRPNSFGSPFSSGPFYNPFVSPFRGTSGYPYYPGVGPYTGMPGTTAVQTAVGGDAATGLTTGHPTRFQYYSQYFLNQGGGATPSYVNPFGMGSTGVPGPYGLGTTGAVIAPRVILGVQPRPNAR